jgi:hypothetical protein
MPAMTAPAKTTSNPTVTATMSEWAAGLQFEDLSPEAVYQASASCSTAWAARLADISSAM